MTLQRAYAPMFPEFDAFLFASIGEEVDGMPLSVLSARDRSERPDALSREQAGLPRLYTEAAVLSECARPQDPALHP
jgi:hypothetical protein